eukprot:scaffold2707_cov417-Prasinococcus_capsulatus_cf.AAC.7
MWYLQPESVDVAFDVHRKGGSFLVGLLSFFTSLILYQYVMRIALPPRKLVGLQFPPMRSRYDSNTIRQRHNSDRLHKKQWTMPYGFAAWDIPAQARTSNLNEELGMIQCVLSDKTGTLTRNQMDFTFMSINGVRHGANSLFRVKFQHTFKLCKVMYGGEQVEDPCQGWNFKDMRIMGQQWLKEPRPDLVRHFLRALALCSTALPSVKEPGRFESESPDEEALVLAAAKMGFQLVRRAKDSITLKEWLTEGSDHEKQTTHSFACCGSVMLLKRR